MLFSEPKIPQLFELRIYGRCFRCFSALQRAENSSIDVAGERSRVAAVFQCSSASRKFLNAALDPQTRCVVDGFSALQRAENSSIFDVRRLVLLQHRFSALQRAENSSIDDGVIALALAVWFQCSSASRKFLNTALRRRPRRVGGTFQCSSASRKFLNHQTRFPIRATGSVSVLFSEPKIPQSIECCDTADDPTGFSALQRAENSSIVRRTNVW